MVWVDGDHAMNIQGFEYFQEGWLDFVRLTREGFLRQQIGPREFELFEI